MPASLASQFATRLLNKLLSWRYFFLLNSKWCRVRTNGRRCWTTTLKNEKWQQNSPKAKKGSSVFRRFLLLRGFVHALSITVWWAWWSRFLPTTFYSSFSKDEHRTLEVLSPLTITHKILSTRLLMIGDHSGLQTLTLSVAGWISL